MMDLSTVRLTSHEQRVWVSIKLRGTGCVAYLIHELRFSESCIRRAILRLHDKGAIRRVQWGVYEAVGDAPPADERGKAKKPNNGAHFRKLPVHLAL